MNKRIINPTGFYPVGRKEVIMLMQELYKVLDDDTQITIVKNDKDIFIGMAVNIPIVSMNEWVDCLKINHEDLVIILK